MKWFKSTPKNNTPPPTDNNYYDAHEQLLIKKIIEILKTNPDNFSARWFGNRTSLCKSVQSNDKTILIMINTGEIIQPIMPKMSDKQKMEIQQLLQPIVKKDSDYIIEKLICNNLKQQ